MRLWKLALLTLMTLCFLAGAAAEEIPLPVPTLEPVEFAKDIVPLSIEKNQRYIANEACYSEDGLSYHDDSLDIRIHKYRAYDTPICVAFVQIADPSQLRTSQARPFPSTTTVHIAAIAKSVKAVIAINADWFVYHTAGIIYRQGRLLRDRPNTEFDALAIDANGDFHIVAPLTREGFDAIKTPIINSFCFGPALVIDGVECEIVDRQVTYRQRTAIGQLDKLTYILVTTDGPEEKDSVGLNMPQLAHLMKELGAINAYNLDGGGSTTMLMNDQKINGQKALKFRSVGDILYFATAVPNQ